MHLVVDSSCIISLHAGSVLDKLSGLTRDIYITDLVADELTEPSANQLRQIGFQIDPLSDAEVSQAKQITSQHQTVSLQDASVMVLARRLGGIVLSDDKPLRELSHAQGLQVHGSLWVLEQLVSHNLISADQLCEALRNMLQAGRRLPKDSVQKLRQRYGCP